MIQLTEEMIKGLYPPNHSHRRKLRKTKGDESIKANVNVQLDVSLTSEIEEDVCVPKKKTWTWIALTPHTSVTLVLLTLLFSFLPSFFQPPFYSATIFTFLLMIFDGIRRWEIFITFVTCEL